MSLRPRDTRDVLARALAVCANAPLAPVGYGVLGRQLRLAQPRPGRAGSAPALPFAA